MRIEIDQSGKVEYTNKPTVVAYSNGRQKSILIESKDKIEIEKIFRKAGKGQVFIYKLFAVLIFLLIKSDLKKDFQIFIDREYSGKEEIIKNTLKKCVIRAGKELEMKDVHFLLVGNKSGSHKRAIEVYRKRIKPDLKVKFRDVIDYLL